MLGLEAHHTMAMNRNNIHRSNGNNTLGLNSDDDFNSLMADPMFQATVLSQLTPITSPTIVANPSQDSSSHLINTRKRTMSAYDSSNVIDNKSDQPMVTNGCLPTKRSIMLPAIKSEPDGISLNSVASSIASTNASNSAASPPLVQQSIQQHQHQQPQSQTQQQTNSAPSENGSNDSFPMQCIRFLPFQQQNWHVLCDQSLQEL